jgi:hypothetical protein
MLSARHSTAITSLAAVMSKPVSRGMPSVRPPRPMTMSRSVRSFMSRTRFHVTRRGSSPTALVEVDGVVHERGEQVVRARRWRGSRH